MCKYRTRSTLTLLILINLSGFGQNQKVAGKINLKMVDNDTMHLFTATIFNSATEKPLQKVDLTFYIQRMFGFIKVGNGTSDSLGIVSLEIPKDLRADQTGHVIFIAKAEDNNIINDTSIQMKLKPDFPYLTNRLMPRAMIGHYAPWWLVITFSLIIGTISLSFGYILYLLYQIKISARLKSNFLNN